MKLELSTNAAPAAIGPYSQGIKAGNFVYCSGQLPIDPVSGLMPDNIKDQTRVSLNNVKAVLAAAGLTLDNVVKTTVYLADMSLFGAMNEVYGDTFRAPYPARSAYAVKELPKQALVEIEVIAYAE